MRRFRSRCWIVYSEKDLKNATEKIHSQLEKDKEFIHPQDFDSLLNLIDSDISDILECNYSPRLYRYYSLISDEVTSLLEYTKDYVTVLVDENSIKESANLLKEESSTFLYELFENGKSISHLSMCFEYDELNSQYDVKIYDETVKTFHLKSIRTLMLLTSSTHI